MWEYYNEDVPQIEEGDLEQIAVPLDFLGINYYNPDQVTNDSQGDPPRGREGQPEQIYAQRRDPESLS